MTNAFRCTLSNLSNEDVNQSANFCFSNNFRPRSRFEDCLAQAKKCDRKLANRMTWQGSKEEARTTTVTVVPGLCNSEPEIETKRKNTCLWSQRCTGRHDRCKITKTTILWIKFENGQDEFWLGSIFIVTLEMHCRSIGWLAVTKRKFWLLLQDLALPALVSDQFSMLQTECVCITWKMVTWRVNDCTLDGQVWFGSFSLLSCLNLGAFMIIGLLKSVSVRLSIERQHRTTGQNFWTKL